MARKSLFGRREFLPFGALHLGVLVACALMAGPKALAVVILVTLVAMLRYVGMALVARSLASSRLAVLASLSLWLTSFAALAAILYVTGSKAPAILVWGAAAALAGPASAFLSALVRGLASIIQPKEEAAA